LDRPAARHPVVVIDGGYWTGLLHAVHEMPRGEEMVTVRKVEMDNLRHIIRVQDEKIKLMDER